MVNALKGQDFNVRNYTINEGLKSDYIYEINQDNQGYIWIATNAGLNKFNGREFIEPSFKGFGEKEIIKMFKDSEQRLWCIQLDGMVFYIKDGKVFQFPPKNYTPSNGFVKISEDFFGNLWIWNLEGYDINIFDLKTLEKIKSIEFENKNKNLIRAIYHEKEGTRVHLTNKYLVYDKNFDKKNNGVLNMVPRYFLSHFKSDSLSYSILQRDKIYTSSFAEPNYSYVFKDFEKLFTNALNDIYLDENKTFWALSSDGIYKFPLSTPYRKDAQHLFKGINTTIIFADKINQIWIGTSSNGIYRLSKKPLKILNEPNAGRFNCVHHNEDYLAVGTDRSQLLFYDKNLNLIHKTESINNKYTIYDISNIGNDFYYVNSNGISKYNLDKKTNTTFLNGFYKCLEIKDQIAWIGGGNNFFKVDLKTNDVQSYLGKRTYSCYAIDEKTALFGSVDGLYQCNGNQGIPLLNKKYFDVRKIHKDSHGFYWIATHSNGVHKIAGDTIVQSFTKKSGLSSNFCRDVCIVNEIAWVATSNGLNKINLSTNKVQVLKSDDGLPSNEINDLSYWNNKLIVSTNKGIAIIHDEHKIIHGDPLVNFSNVKINERDTTLLLKYELKKNERNIKIQFNGVSFTNANDISYQYKMEGIDQDWINSKNTVAQYPNLSPGKYVFKLRAKGINSDWSAEKELLFYIPFRLHERKVFTFIIYLLGFALTYLGFKMYYKEIQKREARKRELLSSKLTALRAQMNPHFIFNSLNSLSDFILQEEKRSANKYLSKFSKLMRMILNNSSKEFLSLDEANESLELYLSLEELRFDNDFKYDISIDEKLDTLSVGIPSMLIQPFVENALIHGLKPKEGIKSLLISFKKIDQFKLLVTVEDNGIGREKSEELKVENSKEYGSKALNITAKRLRLINDNTGKNHKLRIIDLYDEDKNAIGTKIELTLEFINLELYDKNNNS